VAEEAKKNEPLVGDVVEERHEPPPPASVAEPAAPVAPQ
jgi:hypothetical protein